MSLPTIDENPMNQPSDPRENVDARRSRVRRTALWIAVVAVGVYVGFLLLGALGQ